MRYWFFSLLFFYSVCASQPEENPCKTTTHSISLHGKEFPYEATAGTITLQKDKDCKANIFFISYTHGDHFSEKRPITFVFNGGPGSSSVWLHMGAFGPKKIPVSLQGMKTTAPYLVQENSNTILDLTDLVFIDPIGTGYSNCSEKKDEEKFWGIKEDAELIGDFICQYLTTYNRWHSPKYVAGESYGAVRAIVLSEYLHHSYDVFFNGLILISPAIDLHMEMVIASEMEFVFLLPSYAATARFHNKLCTELQNKPLKEFIDEVNDFATNEYLLALIKGDLLDQKEKESIVNKLSYYCGIPKEVIQQNSLRLMTYHFAKYVLESESNVPYCSTVGHHDTRVAGYSFFWGFPNVSDKNSGAYSATINSYLANELQYKAESFYKTFCDASHFSWDLNNGQYNFIQYLVSSLLSNPDMKVFTACGYYDIVTPFSYTQYAINQLHLPIRLQNNIELHKYEGGHMFYFDEKSHKNFKADLSEFYK